MPSLSPPIPGILPKGGYAAEEIRKGLAREGVTGEEPTVGRFGQVLSLKQVLINELGPLRALPVDKPLTDVGTRQELARLNEIQDEMRRVASQLQNRRISSGEARQRLSELQAEYRRLISEMGQRRGR